MSQRPFRRAHLRRQIHGALALLIILLMMGVPGAPTQAALISPSPEALDKVLTALAQLIQERAKRVAARSMFRDVESSLCGGAKLKFNVNGKEVVLYLGHPSVANIDGQDIMFRETCAFIKSFEPELADAALLRTVGEDAVRFLLRLSAIGLDAEQLRRFGFNAYPRFVFDVAAASVREGFSVQALRGPVERLSYSMPRPAVKDVFPLLKEELRKSGVAPVVAKVAIEWGDAGCPYVEGDLNKESCSKGSGALFRYEGTGNPDEADLCKSYLDRNKDRRLVFAKLFHDDKGAKGPLFAGEDDKCEIAFLGNPKKIELCQKARIALNLNDHFAKVSCVEPSEKDFRQFAYTLEQRDHFEQILKPNEAKLKAYAKGAYAAARKTDRVAGLTLAIGAFSALFEAYADDLKGTRAWLKDFAADVASNPTPNAAVFLQKATSLESSLHPKLSPSVGKLRTAMVELMLLPTLYASEEDKVRSAAFKAVTNVRNALIDVLKSPEGTNGPRALVWFARFVDDAAELTGLLGETKNNNEAASLAKALRQLAPVIELAAEKRWTSVAIRTADLLDQLGGKGADTHHMLKFTGVLLSAYEAENVDQAKAILSAALQGELEREERFDHFSVDIGSLFSFAGGAVRNQVTKDSQRFTSVFVPVGVQATYNLLGVLIYPVDVGAYVMQRQPAQEGTTGGMQPSGGLTAEDRKIRVSDALRSGVAVFLRCRRYPVVPAVAIDWRGAYDAGVEERRVMFSLGLELPLFSLF